ncbi:MAG: HEAT repeat domain-containing protein, partial [Polyangiaceae bacterium]
MRRNVPWSAWLICASVFAVASTVGSNARADNSRVTFLTERLQSDDFRVRTQAALALGAVDDDGAVTPLCRALSDSSEIVRQISAAALKRLARPAALGCL